MKLLSTREAKKRERTNGVIDPQTEKIDTGVNRKENRYKRVPGYYLFPALPNHNKNNMDDDDHDDYDNDDNDNHTRRLSSYGIRGEGRGKQNKTAQQHRGSTL